MTLILRVTLVACWAIVGVLDAWAQTNAHPQPVQYLTSFLDQAPTDAELARLPPGARDVIAAKVRVREGPFYLIGRDQSGAPPPLPKDLFAARVEVIDVLKGRTTAGAQFDLSFGVPGPGRRYKYPHTSRQQARDYFIVSHVEDDKERRLLAFPISEQEHAEWEKEVFEHERLRMRPGARDR